MTLFQKAFAIATAASALASALLLSSVTAASNDAAETGRQLFKKRCTGCHSLDTNKEGPRLRNVYGRKAGSLPDFTYSDALRNSKISWDARSLDRWLTNPEELMPDNDMAFHVSNPAERADIIQYLRQTSGK